MAWCGVDRATGKNKDRTRERFPGLAKALGGIFLLGSQAELKKKKKKKTMMMTITNDTKSSCATNGGRGNSA